MDMSDEETKEKARIFDLPLHSYGVPGQVMNPRNHTSIFSDSIGTYDLRSIEEKFREPETGSCPPRH